MLVSQWHWQAPAGQVRAGGLRHGRRTAVAAAAAAVRGTSYTLHDAGRRRRYSQRVARPQPRARPPAPPQQPPLQRMPPPALLKV